MQGGGQRGGGPRGGALVQQRQPAGLPAQRLALRDEHRGGPLVGGSRHCARRARQRAVPVRQAAAGGRAGRAAGRRRRGRAVGRGGLQRRAGQAVLAELLARAAQERLPGYRRRRADRAQRAVAGLDRSAVWSGRHWAFLLLQSAVK